MRLVPKTNHTRRVNSPFKLITDKPVLEQQPSTVPKDHLCVYSALLLNRPHPKLSFALSKTAPLFTPFSSTLLKDHTCNLPHAHMPGPTAKYTLSQKQYCEKKCLFLQKEMLLKKCFFTANHLAEKENFDLYIRNVCTVFLSLQRNFSLPSSPLSFRAKSLLLFLF